MSNQFVTILYFHFSYRGSSLNEQSEDEDDDDRSPNSSIPLTHFPPGQFVHSESDETDAEMVDTILNRKSSKKPNDTISEQEANGILFRLLFTIYFLYFKI